MQTIGIHRRGAIELAAKLGEQSFVQRDVSAGAANAIAGHEAGKHFGNVVWARHSGLAGQECLAHIDPLRKHFEELLLFDRLGDVVAHARFEKTFAIAEHGVRSHGDDGKFAEASARGANRFHRFDAVELRHLHIHQHDVE